MSHTLVPDGTLSTPVGFRVTGIHCGLKSTRDRDLGLLVSRTPCTAAAHASAASGESGAWTAATLKRAASDIRALLLLSGAGFGPGKAGRALCAEVAAILAEEGGWAPANILLLTCGEEPVKLDLLRRGIPRALDELDSNGSRRLAIAMTLDSAPPLMGAVEVTFGGGQQVRIGGGTGGTDGRYLLLTDAAVPAPLLAKTVAAALLRYPALNDSALVVLANGAAPTPAFKSAASADFKAWQEGLLALLAELVR